ncbi:MAG: hypothetical protein R6V54_01530 [Desulfobacteraceae bacterium]
MNTIPMYNTTQSSGPAGYGTYGSAMEKRGSRTMESRETSSSFSKNVDLAIKTREGDIVTLNASSFSDFEAFSYDEKGRVGSGSQAQSSAVSHRSMSLSSGSSFSFSVQGELSEEELDDIQSILKTIDKIVADMGADNMDEAFETARSMGGYDTVSRFTADLETTRSYTRETRFVDQALYGPLAGDTAGGLSGYDGGEVTGKQAGALSYEDPAGKLLEQLIKALETEMESSGKQHPPTPGNLKRPVDQLFNHHRQALDKNREETAALENSLGRVQQQMQKEIDRMVQERTLLWPK